MKLNSYNVKCLWQNALKQVVIDRFAKNVSFIKTDKDHFTVNVDVAVSRQFLSWVIALGEGVRIIGPEGVVDKMKKEVKRLVKQYKM